MGERSSRSRSSPSPSLDEPLNKRSRIIRQTAVTNLVAEEFVFTWKIKNFRHCHENLVSPQFNYGGKDNEFLWALEFYPNGYDNSSSKDYFSVQLVSGDEDGPSDLAEDDTLFTQLALVNKDDEETVFSKLAVTKETVNEAAGTFIDFVEKDFVYGEHNGLLPNNELTIVCRLCWGDHTIDEEIGAIEDCEIPEISSVRRLAEFDDFENLLNDESFSDVKLTVGKKEFHAHKAILSARSSVFSAMFKHAMKEQNDNSVVISDIEPEVMQEVLRFIYVGKVNNIQTLACELLAAADKYQLQGLKSVCEDIIIGSMKVDNICVILNLINTFETKQLKEATFQFLLDNSKKLTESENFKKALKVMSSKPSPLLADVINNLMLRL